MDQVILSLIVLGIAVVVIFFLYRKRKDERDDLVELRQNSLDSLLSEVQLDLTESVREDEFQIIGDVDYEAVIRTKYNGRLALRDCVYGIPSAVNTVKAMIRSSVERKLPTMKEVNRVVDFSSAEYLEPMTKWEILILLVNRRLGNRRALSYLDEQYGISKRRKIDDGVTTAPRRCFDADLLSSIFRQEVKQADLTYAVCIDIVTILLYRKFKGLGCIETLRWLDIDGFHYGTSGSVRYEIDGNFGIPYRATNSVWVQISAKWVHFSFLDFYTSNEMARVTNLISSYGHSAPMNEKSPIKVNDSYDGSRITSARPPAGECWASFVRKFSLSVKKVNWWFGNSGVVKNWELPRTLIYFLMRAQETTPFTGQQNTGKTTLMASAIHDVTHINIRVLEMAFELALREAYPGRDIYTVRETDYCSSEQLQDMLKKSDAYLSLVGEVAQNIVAARMLQFAIIASAFTIFSHHGKDDNGLVRGLAQQIVACGEYKDHDVAISTVLDVIKHNVHLDFIHYGDKTIRYAEYISEIVKEEETSPYPEIDALLAEARVALANSNADALAQCMLAYTKLTREYYTRRTDRVKFSSRKIVVFNKETMSYEPGEWYTPETFERMLKKMNEADRRGFLKFYYDNWRPNEINPYADAVIPVDLKEGL